MDLYTYNEKYVIEDVHKMCVVFKNLRKIRTAISSQWYLPSVESEECKLDMLWMPTWQNCSSNLHDMVKLIAIAT